MSSPLLPFSRGHFASLLASICSNLKQGGCEMAQVEATQCGSWRFQTLAQGMKLLTAHFHILPFSHHSNPGRVMVIVQQAGTEKHRLRASRRVKCLYLKATRLPHQTQTDRNSLAINCTASHKTEKSKPL